MWRSVSILVVFNKHNTARVASCWFIIYYRLVMHGNSNIKSYWYHFKIYGIFSFEGTNTIEIVSHGNTELFRNMSAVGTIRLSDGRGIVVASNNRILTSSPALCGEFGVVYCINWMADSDWEVCKEPAREHGNEVLWYGERSGLVHRRFE